jgi:hypothetical protein
MLKNNDLARNISSNQQISTSVISPIDEDIAIKYEIDL